MPSLDTLVEVLASKDDAPALIVADDGMLLSRGHLRGLVVDFANKLKASGIVAGDVVSISMANTADFVVTFLAVTFARAVAAPLNSAYKQSEFKFYLEDAGSKLLIVPADGNEAAGKAAAELQIPVASASLTATSVDVRVRSGHFKAPPSAPEYRLLEPPRPTDVALFLHTSGTTSRPKGVPLSHANLAASLCNIVSTYELTSADRSYNVMPLFHVHGLMAGLLAPLSAGGAVILPAGGKFSAHDFWKDCCAYSATYYTAVPTIHQVLLARAAKEYPSASPPPLRFIRSCSSSLAPATLHRLEQTFKVPVLEAYAMTEASHQMTSNPLPKYGPRKPGSVGTAQGGVHVAILDADNRLLRPGQIGEVCIRGPNVTAGYLNNPGANAEAFAGGWFHTGDQGWLDAQGYLTLTGRLKELINRGGEKISPLEVDAVLLSHPLVAEAVCFGAPDEKYGEVVAAALVLREGGVGSDDLAADIRRHAGERLAPFKVPGQIFFTPTLPKTATGKIQRRFMVEHFITKGGAGGGVAKKATSAVVPSPTPGLNDGYALTARALASQGVKYMFGVVGIPVTALASAAQAAGVRFIGMRNEQAAGYAAAAAGFLTGRPAALLTVSGPGAVHGVAGLSHASVNGWPLIMLSGSTDQSEVGKGAFQECDQVAAVRHFCKYTGQARSHGDVARVLAEAVQAAGGGCPGAAYVDLPADVLMRALDQHTPLHTDTVALIGGSPNYGGGGVVAAAEAVQRARPKADVAAVSSAAALLRSATRPLLVVGKGAALAVADSEVRELAERFGLPVLCTAMGRGLLPDDHPLCANAARSLALSRADVALVVGARLNWQLHFGEPPRWARDVKFVLADVAPGKRDASLAAVTLAGDAAAVLRQLADSLAAAPALQPERFAGWTAQIRDKVRASEASLSRRMSLTAHPLDYSTALRVLRDALAGVRPHPIVVSEGANTMDNARVMLPVHEARTRLDAATWGTMGVGLGYAVAAAVTASPPRLVVAVEGDSAFGFSGMECETIARYQLPVVILVFNNDGVYGGDRRPTPLVSAANAGAAAAGFAHDPAPTSFVKRARYHQIMQAFGGDGYEADSAAALAAACSAAFRAARPALINVLLDPLAGVESGNVHGFNAPPPKL